MDLAEREALLNQAHEAISEYQDTAKEMLINPKLNEWKSPELKTLPEKGRLHKMRDAFYFIIIQA